MDIYIDTSSKFKFELLQFLVLRTDNLLKPFQQLLVISHYPHHLRFPARYPGWGAENNMKQLLGGIRKTHCYIRLRILDQILWNPLKCQAIQNDLSLLPLPLLPPPCCVLRADFFFLQGEKHCHLHVAKRWCERKS